MAKKSFLLLPLLLVSCGEGTGTTGTAPVTVPPVGGVPTPPPTPSPSPSPPSFVPVIAFLFEDPLLTPSLVVIGKGWQFEQGRNLPYLVSGIQDPTTSPSRSIARWVAIE